MTKLNYTQYIKDNMISGDISYRGGSLKVSVSNIFPDQEEGHYIGAYQNYLGGGMAGAIQSGASFNYLTLSKKDQKIYQELANACKEYFYNVNNGGGDDYMQEEVTGKNAGGYSANQNLPASAY